MIEEYGVIQEKDNKIYFSNIGLDPKHSYCWGVTNSDKIYKVTFEVHEDQSEPKWEEQEYWAWFDKRDKKYKMIWPNYRLFSCCFPYGVLAEELSGKGKSVRLKLVNYEKYITE